MPFRLDRFATLYLVNPLQRRTSTASHSIPILMYHSITAEEEEGVHPYHRTSTSPSVFAVHMRYLYDHQYKTINLPEAVKLLETGTAGKKYAVITFDDGYGDFNRYAFPELQRYGFAATVFLPTAFIGTEPKKFKGKDCLTWREVRELQRSKISFGSHTVTHPQLVSLEAGAVRTEIANSRKAIEDNSGEAVESFAYPFAFPETNRSFVQMLRETLVEFGYRQGVSTRIGTARKQDDPYFLRRLPMNSLDDDSLFRAKLQGGYDWLHKIQYAYKLLNYSAQA